MAKSPKKPKEAATPEPNPGTYHATAENGVSAAEIQKPVAAKKATKKAAPRAKAAGKTGRTTAPRKSRVSTKTAAADPAPSDDEVRTRAYFISEWRKQNGVAGDSNRDWLEACRQLQEEAQQAS